MYSSNLTSIIRNTSRALVASLFLTSVSTAAGKPFSKIITFGDSLSDTGNAYIYTGGFYPAPPNEPGRISNGDIWVEHLADSLGVKLRREDQYAVAGARTDEGNYTTNFGLPLENTGLQSQVDLFLDDTESRGADPNALYTIWIGSNDIFTTLNFGGDMDLTVYNAIQNTAQAVVDLASHGARHIVVVNLPDLGLTPFGQSLGSNFSFQLTFLTDAYNAGLKQALDSLDTLGIPTVRVDSAGLISEVSEDPAAFGLVNASDAAVNSGNDPDGYLFWDDVHPTTVGHAIIADQVIDDLVAFFSSHPGHGRGQRNGHGKLLPLNGRVRAPGR